MPPPVKPTAPPQPLRSQPSTFSARAEAAINYQWTDLPSWMETLAVFVEDERAAAEAAAAAAGAAGGFSLAGRNLNLFRVNAGATATEFVTVETALDPYIAAGAGAQVGDIKAVLGATPPGWILGNGAAVSRTSYAALFAKIGTTHGAGDGATTFNLPNFSGRVIIGHGGGYNVGDTGGAETHSLAHDEMPAHAHVQGNQSGVTDSQGIHTHTPNGGGQFVLFGGGEAVSGNKTGGTGINFHVANSTSSSPAHGHNVTVGGGATDTRGANLPHNNMQPYIVARVVIKF